jgi:hypothetical protein
VPARSGCIGWYERLKRCSNDESPKVEDQRILSRSLLLCLI